MTSTDRFVVLLASDLMLSSTVSGFASSAGLTFRSVGAVSEITEVIKESRSVLLLIDVGLPGLDFQQIAESVPQDVLASAVAYGPHVHTEKLEAAGNAGVGTVMSRGQFSAQAGRLIADFAESQHSTESDG